MADESSGIKLEDHLASAESCTSQIKEEDALSSEDYVLEIEEEDDPLLFTGVSYELPIVNVKVENKLQSDKESGTNDAEYGMREIKIEEVDVLSGDPTPSTESASFSVANLEFVDCGEMEEGNLEVCFKEEEKHAQDNFHSYVSSQDTRASHCVDKLSPNELDDADNALKKKAKKTKKPKPLEACQSGPQECTVSPLLKHLVRTRTKCVTDGSLQNLLNKREAHRSFDIGHSSDLNHHSTVEPDEKLFSCLDCPSKFKHKKSFEKHSLTHCNERPFTCGKCNCAFETKMSLNKHVTIHSNDKLPKRTKTKSKHRADLDHPATELNERSISCPNCASKFKDKKTLNKHLVFHSNARPFTCGECDAAFKTKSNLNKHALVHSNSKPFACSLCPAKFKQNAHLKDHMRLHSRNEQFICSHCLASFAQKSNLRMHLAIHSKEKTFPCPYCPSKFKLGALLKRHMATHTNRRLFRCEQCSMKFKDKRTLVQHLSVVHPIKKPFASSNGLLVV